MMEANSERPAENRWLRDINQLLKVIVNEITRSKDDCAKFGSIGRVISNKGRLTGLALIARAASVTSIARITSKNYWLMLRNQNLVVRLDAQKVNGDTYLTAQTRRTLRRRRGRGRRRRDFFHFPPLRCLCVLRASAVN